MRWWRRDVPLERLLRSLSPWSAYLWMPFVIATLIAGFAFLRASVDLDLPSGEAAWHAFLWAGISWAAAVGYVAIARSRRENSRDSYEDTSSDDCVDPA